VLRDVYTLEAAFGESAIEEVTGIQKILLKNFFNYRFEDEPGLVCVNADRTFLKRKVSNSATELLNHLFNLDQFTYLRCTILYLQYVQTWFFSGQTYRGL